MAFFNKNYDFIGIGDIVTDAFIKLNHEGAHVEADHGEREICFRFGDKVPYEDVYVVSAVGNSSNASVSAARLGLKSALVTNLGDDYFGQECLDALKKEGVSRKFVKIHKGKKTNYHYVLWYGDERTILVKHEEYDYFLPDIGEPKWIYLSSLGGNSGPFHQEMEKYLTSHASVKLTFQPGTYQIRLGSEKLAFFYKRAEAFFCNKDEAQRILGTEENDIKKLLEMIKALGPRYVFITDGVKGAYAFDGKEMLFMPPYPDPKPPVQRTGAGDAFSSTVTVALALGLSLVEALRWGPINSMSVVQGIGARAGLLTREKLEEYLAKAPENYHPQPI